MTKGLKIVTIGGGSSYTPELVEGFIKRYDELPSLQPYPSLSLHSLNDPVHEPSEASFPSFLRSLHFGSALSDNDGLLTILQQRLEAFSALLLRRRFSQVEKGSESRE